MRIIFFIALLTASAHAQLTVIAPSLARVSGADDVTHITYTSFFLNAADTAAFDMTAPTLTAQCWQEATGKQRFDLLINFGGVADSSPWQPFHPTAAHPTPSPVLGYSTLTFAFFGYTKAKPIRLEFVRLRQPEGQLRYNPTGIHSHNLEDATFVMQFLLALPTLRVNDGAHQVEFHAAPLLAQLHSEPLCRASGL
jgi:hypothetical protein